LENLLLYNCINTKETSFFEKIIPRISNLGTSMMISGKELSDKQKYLDEMLLVFKLQLFLEINKFAPADKIESADMFAKIQKNDCYKKFSINKTTRPASEQNKEIKTLFLIDSFLKSRFSKNSFFVSETELNEYSNHTKIKDANKAKEEIRERKTDDAIQLFLSSLNKQITHELLWK
ncbi:MAG: hypothetical protein HQK51_19540, partial [Oligoflexia bacterium]|nr:hypothetical protein [Oligoflexia bacterium]